MWQPSCRRLLPALPRQWASIKMLKVANAAGLFKRLLRPAGFGTAY